MPSVSPGDVIAGKYRVERKLGTGGMGYVVAARHVELGQLVAIKFLTRGAIADDEEALARFRREARSTVRLQNEHIAKVHDVCLDDTDEPFIVMDYLEGCDLGAFARKRGLMPASEAADLILQACEALGEAHSIGLVHRDVKLANLFVTTTASGRPLLKVLDFGISKSEAEGAGLEVTGTHTMLGSPRFMSPEQMNDPRNVDARADIWSLGIILYRLVSGSTPFEAETLPVLCGKVLTEIPAPLSSLCSDLPVGFEHLVARCLAKDRADRFDDVAELACALAPYASDVEAAADRTRHIAAMLGVAPSPGSFAPVVAVVTPMASSISLDHAWSPAQTGEGAVVANETASRRSGTSMTLGMAAIGVFFFLASLTAFRVSAPRVSAAPPPPASTEAEIPPPIEASPELRPAIVLGPDSTAKRRPPHRSPRGNPKRNGSSRPPLGDLPLPDDRH